MIDLFLITALFQLIPARGRKRDADRIVDDRFDISTYPRKGTETSMLVLIITVVHAFQLIPVRGRKHRGGQERALTILFQLIPARGRKHKEDDSGFYFAELFQLIPARGRKLMRDHAEKLMAEFQLIPAKPSQALRASSPEGRAFPAATYLVLSSPFRGSWHGVSRD